MEFKMSIIKVDYGSIGGGYEYLGSQTVSINRDADKTVTFDKDVKIVMVCLQVNSGTTGVWDINGTNTATSLIKDVNGAVVTVGSNWAAVYNMIIYAFG